MRLLVIAPGAGHATVDVFNGLVGGLRGLGHEVVEYNLHRRLQLVMHSLKLLAEDGLIPKASFGQAVYEAGTPIYERVLRERCEAVLVVAGGLMHPDHLVLLRRAEIPTGLVLTETPYEPYEASLVEAVDVAWTNERSAVGALRAHQPNTHHLPHAFDPQRHTPTAIATGEDVPAHDVVFVGTGFQERIEALEAVDWTGIDLGLYGLWQLMSPDSPLRRYLRGGIVDNARTAALYRAAKVGLNLHRTSIGYGPDAPRIMSAESLNPRALELAACEVFQISDRRTEVAEVFGESVPTFGTPAELEATIRRALGDPDYRRQSAAFARQRVQGRTFGRMAEQVARQLAATIDGDADGAIAAQHRAA